MASTKVNRLSELAHYVIRPALVEAKLMTEKRAHDAVCLVTLAEELGSIEDKIAALEEALQLVPQQEEVRAGENAPSAPQGVPDANWIRTKSSELDQRLRRIEHAA